MNYDAGGTVGFTTGYHSVYEQAPDLDAAAGTYEGEAINNAGTETAKITLSADGSLSGQGQSCPFDGTLEEREEGKILNVAFTFGSQGQGCASSTSGQDLAGIAYHNASQDTLIVTANTDDRSVGAFFVGELLP